MQSFIAIDREDEEYMAKNLQKGLHQYIQGMLKNCETESYDRELLMIHDQTLFLEAD